MKKILLGLGAVVVVGASAASMVACGDDAHKNPAWVEKWHYDDEVKITSSKTTQEIYKVIGQRTDTSFGTPIIEMDNADELSGLTVGEIAARFGVTFRDIPADEVVFRFEIRNYEDGGKHATSKSVSSSDIPEKYLATLSIHIPVGGWDFKFCIIPAVS